MRESGVVFSTMESTLNNLGKEVNKIYDKTSEGMIVAMLDTIRRAMKLVPVAYGNLRASSFVIWGKNRNPKVAASFVNNPYSGLTAQSMASQHTSFIDDTRSNILSAAGLKPRMGAIGFTAVYALKIHENPRSGSTGGASPRGREYARGSFATVGQWKYLETPLKETTRIMDTIRKYSGVK
jgi:hypothetical protein